MEIRIGQFDMEYHTTIQGHDEISFSKNGIYHSIFYNNKIVGTVGYLPAKYPKNSGFIQIAISADYRGQGVMKIAEDLIVEKYKLEKLYATIKNNNTASIKAHKKSGFEMVEPNRVVELRDAGLLSPEEIRMEKTYN